MVKSDNGNVQLMGDIITLLADTTSLLHHLYETMIETFGKEFADENIVTIGRLAVMSEDDLEEERIESMINLFGTKEI